MSGPLVPQPEPQATYQAGGGVFVQRLPDEAGIPIRKDDFLTLCEGDIKGLRSNRDLCIGIAGTAFVGLIGVLVAIDWDTVSKASHLKLFLIIVAALLMLAASCGFTAGAFIHHSQMKRTANDSPYSRLRERMLKAYDAQQ